MKTILFNGLLLLSSIIHAQNFDALIQKGDQLYNEEHYAESAKTYDLAFDIKEGNLTQYYNAACSYALSGDTIISIQHLNHSVELGWNSLAHIKSDPDLTSLHEVVGWNKIIEDVTANKAEYEKDLNLPLKAQLEHLRVKDQTLRNLYLVAEEKFGRNSNEMNYFWQLVAHQDSLNQVEVSKVIQKHGWVGINEVGKNANSAVWLVVQHAPIDTQELYIPLLKASVLKGESSGDHLARLEDRVNMRNEKPQAYGSQITRNLETGENEFYEIIDPEYVNQRRAEVGLGPIETYAERMGVSWNIEQKTILNDAPK